MNFGCVGSDGVVDVSVGADDVFVPNILGILKLDLVTPFMVARFFNSSDKDITLESYLANAYLG